MFLARESKGSARELWEINGRNLRWSYKKCDAILEMEWEQLASTLRTKEMPESEQECADVLQFGVMRLGYGTGLVASPSAQLVQ